MAVDDFKTVLDVLARLSRAELEAVRNRCTALLGMTVAPPADDAARDRAIADWLLDGIMSELKNRGLGASVPPLSRIVELRDYAPYAGAAAIVRKLIEEHVPRMKLAEKHAMGIYCARALGRKVEAFAPVSLLTLLRNISMVPEALEESYPGYLQSGNLVKLLNTRWGKRDVREQSAT